MQDTKISIQTPILLQQSSSQLWEIEIKTGIPFPNWYKNCLGINNQKAKNLYSETYKTLVEEIVEYVHTNWKETMCSGIRRVDTIKISTLPKANYKFNVTPMKSQWYPSQTSLGSLLHIKARDLSLLFYIHSSIFYIYFKYLSQMKSLHVVPRSKVGQLEMWSQ